MTADGASLDSGALPAIIVGLDSIPGLGVARVLAARGTRVIGVTANPRHFACRTRVCERVISVADEGEELVRALEDLGGTGHGGVLIPGSDETLLRVSAERERLSEHHHMLLPGHEVILKLADKSRFGGLVDALGLPRPRTEVVRSRDEALAVADKLRYPCVVKPALRTMDWVDAVGDKVSRVWEPKGLMRIYDIGAPHADSVVVQEWIPGPESELFSCYVCFDRESTPLVTFTWRKLRQWPPDVGTSTLGVEVRNDEVREMAVEVFQSAGLVGLGHLEVKRDVTTGKYVPVEPNVGRPTGPGFAEAAGVELQRTAYAHALGAELPAARRQLYTHTKTVYFRNDLRAAATHIRSWALTPRQWLGSLRGPKAFVLLSRTDPVPALVDFAQAISSLPGRLLRRAGNRLRID
ncbi:MAG: carboxylate--amine ligase [Solirubrobacterales bacterium]